MTPLAFCSISALDRPLAAAAEAAAGAGLGGLEVTARPPHLDPAAGRPAAREARRAVEAAGLSVVAYGSYLGREGERSAAEAERAVALCEDLAAPRLRVWAEPEAEAEDEGFARTLAWLRAACDAAAPSGTLVVVERHAGSFADTPERVERLLDAVDRPNVALNYQVLDFLPPGAVAEQPGDAARLVPRARYLHLKNYRPNPSGEGPLAPGGSLEAGVLDYRAILAAVRRAGYADPMTIEFLAWDERSLEAKLAADVAFLRGVLAELGVGEGA